MPESVTASKTRLERPSAQVVRSSQAAASTSRMPPLHSTIPRVLLTTLILALASAGLLWASHFPLGWTALAWVALVPLLCLVRMQASPWWLYLCAWLGGAVFFYQALNWMAAADHHTLYTWAPVAIVLGFDQLLSGEQLNMFWCWVLLAFYCSLYFPAALWLTRRLVLRLNLPLVLVAPPVWVALDFLRSFLMTGFAWYFLGHTQHDFLALIQITDLLGVYGVTALMVACNALIAEWLYLSSWVRWRLRWPQPTWAEAEQLARRRRNWSLAVAGIFVLVLAYGGWRLGEETLRPGPRLALLQNNHDQRLRNQSSEPDEAKRRLASLEIMKGCDRLSTIASLTQPQPQLLVWPETSYPYEWTAVSRDIPPEQFPLIPEAWLRADEADLQSFRLMAQKYRTNLLIGLNRSLLLEVKKQRELGANGQHQDRIKTRALRHNGALLVHREGSTGPVYDKIHRVPFGEYVPLRDWIPGLAKLSPYDFDYSISAGEKMTRFELDGKRFGVLVCYEDTDPELARQYVTTTADGGPVDFLLNISNEGWFDGSAEHEEHLAICRFRAIEARRSIARAVNMGISAVIDSTGRVLQPVRLQPTQALQTVTAGHDLQGWEIPSDPRTQAPLRVADWARFKKAEGIVLASIPIDSRVSLYALWGDAFAWLCSGLVVAGLTGSFLRRKEPALASVNKEKG